MQLVRILRPSSPERVPRLHASEERRRCRHCGFLSIFHPLQISELLATL